MLVLPPLLLPPPPLLTPVPRLSPPAPQARNALAPGSPPPARITFTEVTRRAVSEALASPREVSIPLVDAYLARRSAPQQPPARHPPAVHPPSHPNNPPSHLNTAPRTHPTRSPATRLPPYLPPRALDYLFGLHLSPVLWRRLPGARSAGRVQSAALRLVCEREAAIRSFEVQPYHGVATTLRLPGGEAAEVRVLARCARQVVRPCGRRAAGKKGWGGW